MVSVDAGTVARGVYDLRIAAGVKMLASTPASAMNGSMVWKKIR